MAAVMHDRDAEQIPIDLSGPLEAEVSVVFEAAGRVMLTGPCGAAPWRIESRDRHPLDLVRHLADDAMGPPLLVHSTSWRWERGAVVLSFLVVIEATMVRDMEVRPVERSGLARGAATQAPAEVGQWQVVEHALRHLAWLAREDDVVRRTLSPAWHTLLGDYVPEPFRQLDVEEDP